MGSRGSGEEAPTGPLAQHPMLSEPAVPRWLSYQDTALRDEDGSEGLPVTGAMGAPGDAKAQRAVAGPGVATLECREVNTVSHTQPSPLCVRL